MAKRIYVALPMFTALFLLGLTAAPISSLHAQGLGMIVPLENQITEFGEAGATARVLVFTNGPNSGTTLEIDIKDLFCRSGGGDPDSPYADQVGAAFYSLYIDTVNEPPTRLHIFNTICSTESYRSTYLMWRYLQNTGQTEDDILFSPITFEIKFERDQDGDGIFENVGLVFRGGTD